MRRMIGLLLGLLAAPAIAQTQAPAATPVLQAVRLRGEVACGVHPSLPGFSAIGGGGRVSGFDADTCRAVAAAALGDAEKVRFLYFDLRSGLEALRERRIDVLARNLTQTMARDTEFGLAAAGITLHDGQGFMARRAAGLRRLEDLDGKTVCLSAGATHEVNLTDLATKLRITVTQLALPSFDQVGSAYARGICQVVTADSSALASLRGSGLPDGAAHEILPDLVSREPLGPFVRDGDAQWEAIVFWSVNALIEAEALGIDSGNVGAMRRSPSERIRRLLGAEPGIGAPVGLDDGWVARIVEQVGNYGEMYERNLGSRSPLGLPRGLNALYDRGGLLYPIPMR
jgi:general L-amino acid transport system substrate-binding protein